MKSITLVNVFLARWAARGSSWPLALFATAFDLVIGGVPCAQMDATSLLRLADAGRAPRAKAVARPVAGPIAVAAVAAADMLQLTANTRRIVRNKFQKKSKRSMRHLLTEKRLASQSYNHDRWGLARTADHYMCDGGPKAARAKVKGRSKFRRWTPERVLRGASAPPTAPCRASDRQDKTSPGSYRQSRMIVADIIDDAQKQGLKRKCEESRTSPFEYWITNTMYDETKLPFGKHVNRKRRCLAWHYQCTWRVDGGDSEHDVDVDIVRSPRLLQAYTAANVWQLVGAADDPASLCPTGNALPDAKFHGRLTASDSHVVNKLVSKYAASILPENHFHAAAYCTQHRTGSVCEEVSKKWGLMSPSFCVATQMEHGDFIDSLRTSVVAVLNKYLHCVDHVDIVADDYEYGADERERLNEFAEELLRLCYVQRKSNATGDGEEEEEQATSKRSAKAFLFIRFFPPPWTGILRHPCRQGCCVDRNMSIQRGADLIMDVIIPHLTRPAANRYTKVFPVICTITLMLHFNGVFKKAVRHNLKDERVNSDDEHVLQDADAMLGAPQDIMRHSRKLQAKQRDKILSLVNHGDAMMLFLVWMVVTQVVMVLHYRLFKRGVFYSHMQQSKDEARKRFACFEFCRGADTNPAAKALNAIGSMLFHPDGAGREHLKLIHCRYGGHTSQWPLALVGALQISLLLAFARFWRLLFHEFQFYPWRLASVYDPDAPMALKEERLNEFLNLPVGSKRLDPGLCRKLRAIAATKRQLTSGPLARFLTAFFLRLVMTSTYVERVFGHLTHWLQQQSQELPIVAAKHFTSSFDDIVKRWRNSLQLPREPSGKCRPAWVNTVAKGSRQTGLHVFLESLPRDHVFGVGGQRQWANLPQAEREKHTAVAAQRRKVASARLSRLDEQLEIIEQEKLSAPGGPWDICSQYGPYSLHPDIVSRAYDSGKVTMAAFEKTWKEKVANETRPVDDFPETVLFDGPCKEELPAEFADVCHYMLTMIRLALRFEDTDADSGIVLQFQARDHRRYCFAGHSLHVEREDFEAEILSMTADAHALEDPDRLPLTLTFASEHAPGHDEISWPSIYPETSYVLHLAETMNVQWACYALRTRPLAMSKREVFDRKMLRMDKLQEMDRALAAQRRAMALFRRSAGLSQPRGRGARGGGRGGGSRGRRGDRGRGRGRGRGGAIGNDGVGGVGGVGGGGREGVGGAAGSSGDGDENAPKSDEEGIDKATGSKMCDVSSSESDEDDEDVGGAIAKLKAKLKGMFAPIQPKASNVGAPAKPIVGPRAPEEDEEEEVEGPLHSDKAKPGERVLECWAGKFPFAEVAPGGVLVGYGVHCCRHVNADGTVANTPCKKMVTIRKSGISQTEARLRLKRWLVSGSTARLDPEQERQSHISLGGMHLSKFDSTTSGWGDIPEEELDNLIAGLAS